MVADQIADHVPVGLNSLEARKSTGKIGGEDTLAWTDFQYPAMGTMLIESKSDLLGYGRLGQEVLAI